MDQGGSQYINEQPPASLRESWETFRDIAMASQLDHDIEVARRIYYSGAIAIIAELDKIRHQRLTDAEAIEAITRLRGECCDFADELAEQDPTEFPI